MRDSANGSYTVEDTCSCWIAVLIKKVDYQIFTLFVVLWSFLNYKTIHSSQNNLMDHA